MIRYHSIHEKTLKVTKYILKYVKGNRWPGKIKMKFMIEVAFGDGNGTEYVLKRGLQLHVWNKSLKQ